MKNFFRDFKAFALKGNMVDLAIGMVIATAFNAVVKAIVDDIFMPILGLLTGGHDISAWTFGYEDAQIRIGHLFQTSIDFVIIAFALFVTVKLLAKFKKKDAESPAPVAKPDDIQLLEEIRDLLAKDRANMH